MALTEEDLHKIATNAGLKLAGVDAYIKFMQTRFPKEGSWSYAEEWAERFKSGNPFAYADTQSKKALLNAYGVKGWRGESVRHSLARKGIKTGRKKKTPNKLPTFKYKNRTYVIDQRLNEVRSFEFGKKPITLSGAKGNELIGKAAKVYGKKWVKIKNY